MPRTNYRVALAHEVLNSLPEGAVVKSDKFYIHSYDTQVQDALYGGECSTATVDELLKGKCLICAQGAFVIAHLLKQPRELPLERYRRYQERLESIFGTEQWILIEDCFEGHDNTRRGLGQAFWWQYDSDRETLEAIARNIIRNNGEFKPEQDLKGAHAY